MSDVLRTMIPSHGVELEVFRDPGGGPALAAAHPSEAFDAGTVGLLATTAGQPVACVNPAGLGGSGGGLRPSLEAIVDDLEAARLGLGAGPWVFWGMSGGGWLGQVYARRHPQALAGVIIESACACFRARVADPACVLSPFFPAWRPALAAAGLLSEDAHARPLDGAPTVWTDVAGAGAVFRREGGPALLVSPGALAPAMRAMMPAFLAFDARPWLSELRVPALVLCGDADPVVPVAHARAVHEALAGSAFVTVAGGGHVPTAERRPEVAAAVRAFLAERRASPRRAAL